MLGCGRLDFQWTTSNTNFNIKSLIDCPVSLNSRAAWSESLSMSRSAVERHDLFS